MDDSTIKDLDATETTKESSTFEDPDRTLDTKPSISTKTEYELTLEDPQLRQQLKEVNPLYLPHEFRSLPQTFDPKVYKFPSSYFENTSREKRLLAYADNFRRQYSNRFPDRTPLFLTPMNELHVRKFVCTTIRPTKLPFPELHDASGAASFVADFMDISPLLPCNELPPVLLSPSTTLTLQVGTCFDYTALLCSLLIGVGYNAYVVSGYATRECCFKDESRKQCPNLTEEPKKVEMYRIPRAGKYRVKPIKEFISKYEVAMKVKELIESKEGAEKKEKEDKELREKDEEPPPDPLYGLRVHSWILILPGSRDVEEVCFIEPFTGESLSIKTTVYLGIESVWNGTNYWVNMQDCTNGIGNMRYDLNALEDWEFMLPSGLLNEKLMPANGQLSKVSKESLNAAETLTKCDLGLDYGLHLLEDERKSNLPGEGTRNKPEADLLDTLLLFDLPVSWTRPITLSDAQYHQRYPNCQKIMLYNRARLIKFSPYSQKSGMVTKLTIYSDKNYRNPIEEREYFENRKDKLVSRITDMKKDQVRESFAHGRMGDHLRTHSYLINNPGVDASRSMEFYQKIRIDGLMKRERDGAVMKEWYENRDDRLIYRETHFGRTVRKFGSPLIIKGGPQQHEASEQKATKKCFKEIEIIKECFSRNPDLPADEDVEERTFDINANKYYIKYHVADDCIFPCRREFNKPVESLDRRQVIELQPDTHTAFHTKLNPPRKTNVEIYQMLLELTDLEREAKEIVRASESEVQSILDARAEEELKPDLEVGLWDTLRNEEMQKLRVALEGHAEQERKKQREKEMDFLAPYFYMLDIDGDNLSRADAYAAREACLKDLKERLIKKANIIQARLEAETSALQRKQQWFQLNQINLTKDDETAYLQYCSDAALKIATLESTLLKHKETAPLKYMLLEKQLRTDPRLADFLDTS
ncbi:hypothetical protein Aperf_G00000059071 [Anoplocephala perfoliata]